jgi:HSP20 family protein
MKDPRHLDSQHKRELESTQEKTVPGKYFIPFTDIFETADALVVVMEMPGVARDDLDIRIEKDVLLVEGRIDFAKYANLKPVYTEYNVGHFTRSFSLSNEIDQGAIGARVVDGVLTLTLPKARQAEPRRIVIGA